MRLLISLISLIIYVGVFNFYIYELPRPNLNIVHCKLLFFGDTLFIMAFIAADRLSGFTSPYHEQLNVLCYIALMINFLLCLLIVANVLNKNNWQTNLYVFNGSIFVTSLIILKSMAQHGYFKDRYEND